MTLFLNLHSYSIRTRSNFPDLLDHFCYHLRETGTFRCRDPLEAEALRLQPKILQHQVDGFCAGFCPNVPLKIMAVTGMAAAHENSVGTARERFDHEVGMDHPCALNADDASVCRVLHTGGSRQIRAGVGAPVAAEVDD